VKCEKAQMKLSAYMDGEVDAELHRQIDSHLEHCPECRVELEGFGGVDSLIRDLPRYSPHSDFAAAVVSKVEDVSSPGQKRPFLPRAWKAVLEYSERFLELLDPQASAGTRSLDEFNDIPASFIGYAYFKVLGSQR
jgi:anti-sigma factor RsiW